MATLYVNAKENAAIVDCGSGFSSESAIREVSFGPVFGGSGPNHFDMRNIKVGTTSFGSSDLFSPVLADDSEFDGFFGSGTHPTFSGGVMSFNNTDDRYGYKDLGADYDAIYVQFELRVHADDNDPDYHDIGQAGDSAAEDFVDGFFNNGSTWEFDGPGVDFGAGAVKDGTTWTTLGILWSYSVLPPVAFPFVFDSQRFFRTT